MMKSTVIAMIGSTAAKWGFGGCPQVEFMDNLDMPAYSGHWFEIYRDKHNMYTQGADCVTKEFEYNKDGNLDLYFRGYYNWHGWGKYSGVNGELSDCGSNMLGSSTCMATMGGSPHKIGFQMLATDYVSYDISYACKSFWGLFHGSNLAISSREMEMSDENQMEVRKVINEKIPEYNLEKGMYWTKQGEDRCQYYWMSDNQGKTPEKINW